MLTIGHLKKLEDRLSKLCRAIEKVEGRRIHEIRDDPVVERVFETWTVAYAELQRLQFAKALAAEDGRTSWEVFRPGGQRHVGTPFRYTTIYSHGYERHAFMNASSPDSFFFRDAMGHV